MHMKQFISMSNIILMQSMFCWRFIHYEHSPLLDIILKTTVSLKTSTT